MRAVSATIYTAIFFAATALVGAPCYFGTWMSAVAACGPAPQGSDAFLAACTQPNFGDFEHAAYIWDLEPNAVRALQAADVIFLGNSRLQFAFSTQAVSDYFSRNGISYYVLGFGYDEKSPFTEQLSRKYHLKPKAYIINADPFFADGLSLAARELQGVQLSVWLTYAFKLVFVQEQRLICSIPWLCVQSYPTLYRVPQDGSWIWHDFYFPPTLSLPVTSEKRDALTDSQLSRAKVLAREFVAASNMPPECIILTGIPTSIIASEGVAAEIGRAAGLQVVLSDVQNLSTVDQSHLNADSAERWSAAFVEKMAPVLDRCLALRGGAPGAPPS
jgi:hypothetical protein